MIVSFRISLIPVVLIQCPCPNHRLGIPISCGPGLIPMGMLVSIIMALLQQTQTSFYPVCWRPYRLMRVIIVTSLTSPGFVLTFRLRSLCSRLLFWVLPLATLPHTWVRLGPQVASILLSR
uniref:Uncharacterized protein n=1 Tax=Ditylenchus dipsaci TaxID=166011 RepID=A0A915DTB9_9BILA